MEEKQEKSKVEFHPTPETVLQQARTVLELAEKTMRYAEYLKEMLDALYKEVK